MRRNKQHTEQPLPWAQKVAGLNHAAPTKTPKDLARPGKPSTPSKKKQNSPKRGGQHFNGLTPAEAERIALLIEECAEVQQTACKVLRHGYESDWKGQLPETNRQALQREIGDLLHVIIRLTDAADVCGDSIRERAASKAERCAPFLHHQGGAR